MAWRFVMLGAALLIVTSAAFGGDLFYMDHDPFTDKYTGPVGPLVLSGEITPGDMDQLLAKIAGDEKRFLGENKVILALNDGDATEAIKIANLLKSMLTEVSVGSHTGRCVGACFLIYAAAAQRNTDGEGLLGLYRPSLSATDAAAERPAHAQLTENRVLQQVHEFIDQNEVPVKLSDELFEREANDVYWLSGEDEAAMGLKAPWFKQYLAAKCSWDDSVERDVLARKRPMDDLKQLWSCRARVTQPVARKALEAALKDKVNRDTEARLRAEAD